MSPSEALEAAGSQLPVEAKGAFARAARRLLALFPGGSEGTVFFAAATEETPPRDVRAVFCSGHAGALVVEATGLPGAVSWVRIGGGEC